jgi:hypothetical protein
MGPPKKQRAGLATRRAQSAVSALSEPNGDTNRSGAQEQLCHALAIEHEQIVSLLHSIDRKLNLLLEQRLAETLAQGQQHVDRERDKMQRELQRLKGGLP